MTTRPWATAMRDAIINYNAALAEMNRIGALSQAASDSMNAVRVLIDQPQLWQAASPRAADVDAWTRVVGAGLVCACAAATLPPASLLPSTL